MLVTELGIVTLVSPVHSQNAQSSILVTELGIVTLVIPLHPLNTCCPIFVIPSPMTSFVKERLFQGTCLKESNSISPVPSSVSTPWSSRVHLMLLPHVPDCVPPDKASYLGNSFQPVAALYASIEFAGTYNTHSVLFMLPKALSPQAGGFSAKDWISFTLTQYLNASSPMLVTELGMVTLDSDIHDSNALIPIVVIPSPMTTFEGFAFLHGESLKFSIAPVPSSVSTPWSSRVHLMLSPHVPD